VGKSPRAIATDLNRDGIPGPFGHTWGDTTIRGHACRGNGVVNNELYAGVLVWNRQRFIKDPSTGKRVSRPNPEAKWIRTEGGGRSSDDYLADLVDSGGEFVSPVVVSTKEPSVKWVSRADQTREEGELDDLAPEIVGDTLTGDIVKANRDFRVIAISWDSLPKTSTPMVTLPSRARSLTTSK
jgi:hypothetical protein